MKIKEIIENRYIFNSIIFFLTIYFSLFFFRGRLGADDLQTFNVAFNFVETNLDFKEFFSLNYDNSIVLMHRKIWLLIDFIIIKISFLLGFLEIFNVKQISKYLSGLMVSFYAVVSFILFFSFLVNKKYQSRNICLSFFITFSIFFGTGLISFFSGSYLESLVFLLFLIRYKIKNKIFIFLIDIILINIKPYYLAIILGLEFTKIVDKKFSYKYSLFPCAYILLLTIIFFLPNFFLGKQFTEFQTGFGFNLDILFIFNNLTLFFFSPGQGIIFTWSIILIFITLGFDRKKTLVKIFFVCVLIIFLCSLGFWNGFSPGNRYLLSILPIFIDEIISSKNYLIQVFYKKKFKLLLSLIYLLTILNLPTLEYRNTSIHEYERKTSLISLNKNYYNPGIDDSDVFFIPLDKIDFHHTIFSLKILINKIQNQNSIKIAGRNLDMDAVYPMNPLLRLLYISKHNLNYLSDNYLFLINKYRFIINLIYVLTISFLILIFSFSFFYAKKLEK